jgi:hypothetical protein
MVTSLSDLCARLNAVTSLVVQVDRRQVADRRKTRRGGRRADDVNASTDPVDMRSVALRRALISSHPSIDSAASRLATAAGRRLE